MAGEQITVDVAVLTDELREMWEQGFNAADTDDDPAPDYDAAGCAGDMAAALARLTAAQQPPTLVRDESRSLSAYPVQQSETVPNMGEAAEMLWGTLANVGGGDWTTQSEEWQIAAARWRDNYFKAKAAQQQPEPVMWSAEITRLRATRKAALHVLEEVEHWNAQFNLYESGSLIDERIRAVHDSVLLDEPEPVAEAARRAAGKGFEFFRTIYRQPSALRRRLIRSGLYELDGFLHELHVDEVAAFKAAHEAEVDRLLAAPAEGGRDA